MAAKMFEIPVVSVHCCCRKLAKNYIPKVDRTDKRKEPEYVTIFDHLFLAQE